jgi:hypothetical protein
MRKHGLIILLVLGCAGLVLAQRRFRGGYGRGGE